MKKILSLFTTAVLVLCLAACSATNKKTKYNAYYFDFFDTATTITCYTETKEEFDAVCAEIKAQLNEYHRLFDIYTRYDGLNNLVTVNDVKGGKHQTVRVDEKIIDIAMKCIKESNKKIKTRNKRLCNFK